MESTTAGVLAIWHDIEADAQAEADLFEWYNRQHHPERFAVPGFVRARRYEAVEGGPRIFSRYDTTTPSVLTSAPYLERLENPTDWTRRCMPLYRNMSRTVCRVLQRFGRGEGGKLVALRFDAEAGAEEALVRWVVEEAFPAIEPLRGIVGGQLLAAHAQAGATASTETRLRGTEDHRDGLVALLTGNTVAGVKAAEAVLAGADGLRARGAAGKPRRGIYELVFDLSALD